MATAVLTAYDPEEFGILDWRALKGLERIGWPIVRGQGETLRYLLLVRELRDAARVERPSVTARNMEQGLWILGGTS